MTMRATGAAAKAVGGAIGVCVLLTGCAQEKLSGDEVAELEEITSEQRDGRLVFAPQPSELDLAWYAEHNFDTIINTRSLREIEDTDRIGYDQRAAVEELGFAYVEIPLGGKDGYEPADVDAFAEAVASALNSTEGDVLVHCGSGGRARMLWAAYLVEHQGMTLNEAAECMRGVGHSNSSLERLLNRRVEYSLGAELPPEEEEPDEG